MAGYIKYVIRCKVCNGAIGMFTDNTLKHIEIIKSAHPLMADTINIIEKDHMPIFESVPHPAPVTSRAVDDIDVS
jgi:hypothetical protein